MNIEIDEGFIDQVLPLINKTREAAELYVKCYKRLIDQLPRIEELFYPDKTKSPLRKIKYKKTKEELETYLDVLLTLRGKVRKAKAKRQ